MKELIADQGIVSVKTGAVQDSPMREIAITIIAGTRTVVEDLVPALVVFAAVFSMGIYAKGFLTVPYAAGAF